MRLTDRTTGALAALAARLASGARAHPRISAAGAGSLAAGALALVLGRRGEALPPLPDAEALATVAAGSVHNAAKGAVIAAVREDGRGAEDVALEAVRQAVIEAAAAGADVTAAAIGGVEGAISLAEGLHVEPLPFARRAAVAAHVASGSVGPAAAVRVREALAPLLDGAPAEGAPGA